MINKGTIPNLFNISSFMLVEKSIIGNNRNK